MDLLFWLKCFTSYFLRVQKVDRGSDIFYVARFYSFLSIDSSLQIVELKGMALIVRCRRHHSSSVCRCSVAPSTAQIAPNLMLLCSCVASLSSQNPFSSSPFV